MPDLHPNSPGGTANIDPITFEVIRHKLEAITEEQAITLKKIAGVSQGALANNFNMRV